MDMVERVAQAIEAAMRDSNDSLDMARAAIDAMREPTAEMGQAIYAAWDAFGEDAIMGPEEAIAIYRASIDAALGKIDA